MTTIYRDCDLCACERESERNLESNLIDMHMREIDRKRERERERERERQWEREREWERETEDKKERA